MDLFSSSYSSFQEEELIHGGMFYWSFSPEPFDLVASVPDLLPSPVEESPVVSRSAFTQYSAGRLSSECSSSRSGGYQNIHRRVIEFLRRIPKAKPENKSGEFSRGFRHMMRERQRREKLSQSYADLHTMLPYRSKADKNSIVQSAAAYVHELKGVKEELQRRNEELKMRTARESNAFEGTKIKFRVANPPSTIDSMIGALRCLKGMDVKAKTICSEFSGNELTAFMSIETKVGATEVQRAVESALMETRRSQRDVSTKDLICHVKNAYNFG